MNNTNNNNNNINFFQEVNSGNHVNNNNNKRKGGNQLKSGRKDILEEIFGDDLFASLNRAHSPAMSKNKPQLSKKTFNNPNIANNNNNNNRYEDMFATNLNTKANANNANNKDPFDFVLDYDQSFLRDDQSKLNLDNQFNTRRSRYLPSGKLQQDSFFNMNSATQNSAKGWNQSPIKITVGGNGMGGNGGGGGATGHHHGIGSGKGGPNGGGYVPSFIGSSKGDKKSKY